MANEGTEEKNTNVRRDYKARLFEMIFREKEELLGLYNAVNGTNYSNPDELEINTLENAIYLSMHNDVSFIIDSRLSLYEHQSTYSPNLPLRYLFYVSDLYSKMTKDSNLYGSRRITIPAPRFLIFYNGKEARPEREVLELSDAFEIQEEELWLNLKAVLLNINPGYNNDIVNACKTLRDYVTYTSRVRQHAEQMKIEDAVEQAITECIAEGILADFLTQYRSEVKKMSIYEYDEEQQRRWDKEEGEEIGLAKGLAKGENRFAALASALIEAGQAEDILKATKDMEYRQKLYKEYGIQ